MVIVDFSWCQISPLVRAESAVLHRLRVGAKLTVYVWSKSCAWASRAAT